eukprot:CAMPEP_0197187032 /NCGR_PEP_ID=MMETSP1423-20130617/15098_1 /TAXON_ID=476441 /ORGANISM="Pseudo-nitzschia heimii, Strain UNC1101" /LENGTH=221 /DNA_ID=CAMNT_0042638505 /DNA_START=240 /DNA_END=905 /DNA_ORIENTATION=+
MLPLQGQWDIRGIEQVRRNGNHGFVEARADIVVTLPYEDGKRRPLDLAVAVRGSIYGPCEPLRDGVAVGAPTPGPWGPVAAVLAAAGQISGAVVFTSLANRSGGSELSIVLAAVQITGIVVSQELDLPPVLAAVQICGIVVSPELHFPPVLAAVLLGGIIVSPELDLSSVLAAFLEAAVLVVVVVVTFFTVTCLPGLVLVRTVALFSKICVAVLVSDFTQL